jgi:hypothetical protein
VAGLPTDAVTERRDCLDLGHLSTSTSGYRLDRGTTWPDGTQREESGLE